MGSVCTGADDLWGAGVQTGDRSGDEMGVGNTLKTARSGTTGSVSNAQKKRAVVLEEDESHETMSFLLDFSFERCTQ